MAQRDKNGLTYDERLLKNIMKALDEKDNAEPGSKAEAKAKAKAEALTKQYFELHDIFNDFHGTVGGFGVTAVKDDNGEYIITFSAKIEKAKFDLPL